MMSPTKSYKRTCTNCFRTSSKESLVQLACIFSFLKLQAAGMTLFFYFCIRVYSVKADF